MNKKQVLEDLLLRAPILRPQNLHYNSKKLRARLTEAPKPLVFPLKPLPEDHQFMTKPLGTLNPLPFHVNRTHTGNLPVYAKYRNHRHIKKTIIRLVSGDIEEFTKELSKVVSNSEVIPKVGKVEVKGLHTESVNLWLKRLGF